MGGMWRRRLGHLAREKEHFVPKMISLCAFDAVFSMQKTRTVTRSLGTRILRFNRETKLTKTMQKLSKKFMVGPSGRSVGLGGLLHLVQRGEVKIPENTPASQALQLSIEAHTGTPPAADWKRTPGRPRRNWLQQLEEDTGLSVGAAWIAGQDRSMWRTLRPSAGQAQQ